MKTLFAGLVVATVLGSPLAVRANCHGGAPEPAPAAPAKPAASAPKGSAAANLEIVLADGVSVPRELAVKAGQPVHLSITRKTNRTCATKLVVRDYAIDAPLPLGKTVVVDFTPKASGKIRLLCGMGESISTLVVE